MSDVCLVMAADQNQIVYTKTVLKSVSANYHGTDKLPVFVLVPEDMVGLQSKFEFSNLDVTLAFPEKVRPYLESGFLDSIYKNVHFTPASSFRFFIGDICSMYKKAVYLDSDVIVARDIAPLLDFELKGTPVAAFPEIQLQFPKNQYLKDTCVFNSGVMVIDVQYFAKNDMGKVLMELASNLEDWVGYVDQDIMNIVFKNNYTPLPITFNYLINMYKNLEVLDPLVVHWAGRSKPWGGAPKTKWRDLWNQYHTTT